MRTVVLGALVSLLFGLLMGGVGSASQAAETRATSRSVAARDYAQDVAVVTNQRRAAHQRTQLRQQACLQRHAELQAERMANRRQMFHQDLGVVLRRCGMRSVAENVAAGFPDGRSAVWGWMHSAGHRRNILTRSYRLTGVAARKGGGRWYVAQVFGRS
ncbi:CAP domain-containing protein [Nocardioides sp. Root151]|uniref:CAP domain-containing protein n=1 Tax=Nocardioides sp. Root151 TaxID=1736475 RepID=UPI00070242D5|nr:CAP domain-containing protein [Nocardioides sp. Root151]KQZ67411.1 hypothetical protein ASD66_20930 [Nocardioides sp. Root151]